MIANPSDKSYNEQFRGIAQSGSAPALGAGCREFESLYPDQISIYDVTGHLGLTLFKVPLLL